MAFSLRPEIGPFYPTLNGPFHPTLTSWSERGFETPTSMRSVDASCEADLMLREYTAKED